MTCALNIRTAPNSASPLPEPFLSWFVSRGWTPREHQLELLARARAGRSVLLIAPTGAGKTLAGFLPSLVELSAPSQAAPARKLVSTGRDIRREGGLHTLYISPLKALAVDIARNLERPVAEMRLPIRIETRTGDTPTSKRQRQRRDPPHILLSTPEQLALILALKKKKKKKSGVRLSGSTRTDRHIGRAPGQRQLLGMLAAGCAGDRGAGAGAWRSACTRCGSRSGSAVAFSATGRSRLRAMSTASALSGGDRRACAARLRERMSRPVETSFRAGAACEGGRGSAATAG